jgi:hypothetical protein
MNYLSAVLGVVQPCRPDWFMALFLMGYVLYATYLLYPKKYKK